MEENINTLISILKDNISKCEEKDKTIVNQHIEDLYKIKNDIPSSEILELINEHNNYLDIKYDFYNELSYYFDPVYVSIKNTIHKKYVDNLRIENKNNKIA